ncbi:hypothetical protein PO909_002065 [Leuciscus waleckii]
MFWYLPFPPAPSVTLGFLMEFEGMEWSHTPFTEGELHLASALYEELEDDISLCVLSLLVPSSSKSPPSPVISPSLPLPPPLLISTSSSVLPPLFPFSPSALPLTPLCCVDLPWVFRSPAPPCQEDPLAPPPVAEPVTPTWLADLPWLHLRPSSLWLHRTPFSSTSVRRRSACATVFLGFQLHFVPPPFGFASPLAPWLYLRLSPSASPGSPPPSAPPLSVVPLVKPAKSPSWLLPPSAESPWAFVWAVVCISTWLLLLLAAPNIIAFLVSPADLFSSLSFTSPSSTTTAPTLPPILDFLCLRCEDLPSGGVLKRVCFMVVFGFPCLPARRCY